MIAMKQKPRWMKSVIKAATQEQGPLPFGRRKTVPAAAVKSQAKPAVARA